MVYDAVEFLESLFRTDHQPVLPDISPDELPEDWRKKYIERAAILEFGCGSSREYAEAYALRETLKAMRAASRSSAVESTGAPSEF